MIFGNVLMYADLRVRLARPLPCGHERPEAGRVDPEGEAAPPRAGGLRGAHLSRLLRARQEQQREVPF